MKSGMCWSFGSNTDGQLGVDRGGPEWSNTPVPCELTGKQGSDETKQTKPNLLTKLAAGAGHSVALTIAGNISKEG